MPASSQKGVAVSLLPAGTTGSVTGTAIVVPISAKNIRVHARGVGAIGAGTIIIEEALDPAFSGTWSTIFTFTGTALAGGVEQVLHIFGTASAIRARSAGITVGTVSVDLMSD